ncbi:MAG: glycosyltransferase [Prolixibacteraceae bacterium]
MKNTIKREAKKNSPKVSVIMPAFNSEKFITEAIDSILHQTFTDFELIIIDDGSTDKTFEIAKSYYDKRIILLQHNTNLGNYPARNLGMEKSKGEYICVMDSDDIATSNRIEQQYLFMESNEDVGICGGYTEIIDSSQKLNPPNDYIELKVWLLSNIIFKHPTIFIRRNFLSKYKLNYNTSFRYAADYDFLVRSAEFFPITNIPEVVLRHRRHPDQISQAKAKEQSAIVSIIQSNQLRYFNIMPSEQEKVTHLKLMNRVRIEDKKEFDSLLAWANKLVVMNSVNRYFDGDRLSVFLKNMLKNILINYEISKASKVDHIKRNEI